MTVNVRAPELFGPRRPCRKQERDAFLRANASLDPELLAAELGVSENYVRMLQRKIGVRKCTYAQRMADRLRRRM